MTRKTPEEIRNIIETDEREKHQKPSAIRTAMAVMAVDIYAALEKNIKAVQDATNPGQSSKIKFEDIPQLTDMIGTLAMAMMSCATVASSFVLTNEKGITAQIATASILAAQLEVLMRTTSNNDPKKIFINRISGMTMEDAKTMVRETRKREKEPGEIH